MQQIQALVFAIAIVGFAMNAASAGTKQLSGKYGISVIENDCFEAGGTVTGGTGPGGYGCKTSKGEVSCTSGGVCTGTCGNCKPQTIGRAGVVGTLRGGATAK
jgi:hypothetical protein